MQKKDEIKCEKREWGVERGRRDKKGGSEENGD
jgi:hypothetical protein